MATQEEILAKANEVTTSVVGNASGGLLNAEQSNRFIDFVVDQSNLMKNSRVVRMRTPTMDIDKVSVGTRLMSKATEATETGSNAAVTFTKVSLSSVKLRLDWELSTESLEDNIEGASLEDHLAQHANKIPATPRRTSLLLWCRCCTRYSVQLAESKLCNSRNIWRSGSRLNIW